MLHRGLLPRLTPLLIFAGLTSVAAQSNDPRGDMELQTREVVDQAKKAYNDGNTAFRARDYPKAAASYQAATEHNPEYANAFFGLGLTFRKMRRSSDALSALDKAIELKPEHSKALATRASVRMDQKDYKGAVADYTAATEVRPNDYKTFFKLALAQDRAKNTAGAISAYQQAVKLNPKYAKAHKNLGLLQEKAGNTDGAIRAFKNACESGSDSSSCTKWAENLAKARRYEQAEKAVQTALKRKPGDAYSLVTYGEILEGLHNYDYALQQYEKAKGDATWGPTATYKIEALKKKRG